MKRSRLLAALIASQITFCAVTELSAAPVTYKFTGVIDTVTGSADTTVAVGDSWVAYFTFEESNLGPGTTSLFEEDVLSWQLTVPTDPRFDIGSSTEDILFDFAATYGLPSLGPNEIQLFDLTANRGAGTIGVRDWIENTTTGALSITYIHGLSNGFLTDIEGLSNTIGSPVVPIPPAIWLFASGLLGMIGIARRKKAA